MKFQRMAVVYFMHPLRFFRDVSMKKNARIYEQGSESYPKKDIIFYNLMMILWVALGMVACWFFSPFIAWIYLIYAVVVIGVVLRIWVCPDCYYHGKWCFKGWGKLSGMFVEKGSVDNFNKNIGVKLAPVAYGLLSLIPTISILATINLGAVALKIVVLVLLLLISYYNAVVGKKRACIKCKMRSICPGSVVKEISNNCC